MDGETPDAMRIRTIQDFANGEIMALTNCDLLTTGFDLASQIGRDVCIESMSDLRPTKSLALQMQKWGRALRYKHEPALIFDHANNIKEHGLPCDEREWTLQDRDKATRASSERAIPVKQCDNCFFCHEPAPKCPNCGYVYPVKDDIIEETDDDLAEIEIAEAKKQKRMEVGQAQTLDDLKRIAKERGYKQGWVFKQAQIKRIPIS
jgi:superfamily II DNA or RNA helicase